MQEWKFERNEVTRSFKEILERQSGMHKYGEAAYKSLKEPRSSGERHGRQEIVYCDVCY